MDRSTIAAAILAGGRARRFGGRDKCRLIVEGRAIIVRQLDVLQAVASEVFVVGAPPDRFVDLGVPVHGDLIPDIGAVGGLYTALEVARAPYVVVVACDMPFLEAPLLERLTDLAAEGDGAWVRTARGVEPLLGCYRRTARDVIRREIAAKRLKASDLGAALRMVDMGPAEIERFGSAERLLANVNTPDDYARIQ